MFAFQNHTLIILNECKYTGMEMNYSATLMQPKILQMVVIISSVKLQESLFKLHPALTFSPQIIVFGAQWVKIWCLILKSEKVALQWSSLSECCSIQKRPWRWERSEQPRYWKRGLLASTISLANKMLPPSLLFLLIFSATGRSLYPDSDHTTMHWGLWSVSHN